MTTLDNAAEWAAQQRHLGRKVILTSGCFDLLHLGHVRHLQDAREIGDALVVAINSDESVRRLKGAGRPKYRAEERSAMLAALRSVDCVTVFQGDNASEAILMIRPYCWVKGGDYSRDNIHPDEKAALDAVGAWPLFIARIPGYSTTQSLLNANSMAHSASPSV